MSWILAVDPGLTGAIAFCDPTVKGRVSVYDMPVVNGGVDVHQLQQSIKQYAPVWAYIEQVGPMPRDGVRQVWRFSGAYHTVKTLVQVMRVPLTLIPSATWKKAFHLKGGPAGKEQSRAEAIKIFPHSAHLFERKKDHNRAEAALLAHYIITHLNRNISHAIELSETFAERT